MLQQNGKNKNTTFFQQHFTHINTHYESHTPMYNTLTYHTLIQHFTFKFQKTKAK